jgi:hypothetical protein
MIFIAISSGGVNFAVQMFLSIPFAGELNLQCKYFYRYFFRGANYAVQMFLSLLFAEELTLQFRCFYRYSFQ